MKNQNLTDKELKSQARILREYLTGCGVAVTHSQMLEGLARVHGHRNLATARASFPPEVFEHSEAETKHWVDRVMWYGTWWNNVLEDSWYVYPAGVTFEQTENMDLQSLRLVPDDYRLDPKSTCVSRVFAELPSIAQYDIPALADYNKSAQELAEHGFGLRAEGVHVRRHDRQDDGGENYWIAVRMPAEVSEAIDRACRGEFVEVLAELIRERAEGNDFAVTRATLEELAFEECSEADMGEPTKEELEALRWEFGF